MNNPAVQHVLATTRDPINAEFLEIAIQPGAMNDDSATREELRLWEDRKKKCEDDLSEYRRQCDTFKSEDVKDVIRKDISETCRKLEEAQAKLDAIAPKARQPRAVEHGAPGHMVG